MPRIRPEGGLYGAFNNTSVSYASGMWTMRDLDTSVRQGNWPVDVGPADPYFNYNTVLIHADGTNNANNNLVIDSSNTKIPFANTYSVYFDGTGDYIVTASNATAFDQDVDFTLEFWFNVQAFPGSQDARFWSPTSVAGLGVGISSGGKILVDNQATGYVLTSTETISLDTWYHFALVRNGPTTSNLIMYVNGVTSNTISYSSWQTGMSTVTIGRRTDTSTDLNGYMSNLRWVRGNAVYTSSFTPSTTPLTAIANTQLLTFQSSTIVDNSPNAFALTLTGTPTATTGAPITRTSNPGQGTFSPYSVPAGYWSNFFDTSGYHSIADTGQFDWGVNANWTFECWINPSSWHASQGDIFGSIAPAAASTDWTIYLNGSGNPVFYNFGDANGTTITGTSVIPRGQWSHLAVCIVNGVCTMYVNGVAASTPTARASASTGQYSGYTIGQGNSRTWQKSISNLRIVNGTALYTGNFTPSIGPLSAITNTKLLCCCDNRFFDNSTLAHAITLSGSVYTSPFSPFAPTTTYLATADGGSYSFNGSSDYFRVVVAQGALGLSTGDFTVEWWGYYNSVTTSFAGIGPDFRTSGGGASQVKPNFLISTSTGNFVLGVSNATRLSYPITAGQWYHFACVRSSSVTKLFVNGVANNTTYADTNDYGSTSQITIGTVGDNPGAASYFCNGFVGDVRVTKRALYSTNFTPSTTPLTAVANTTFLLSATSANIIDQTGKASFATGGGTRISTTQSKFGGSSIFFNGTTDFLRVESAASTKFLYGVNDFTIEFFVFFVALQGNLVDFRTGTASLVLPTIYVTANTIRYYVSGADRITSSTLTTNQWYHVALVRSAGVTKLYIDGTQSGSSYTDTNNYIAGSPYIGRSNDGTNTSFFSGYLDEIRFSQYARYTANFTPPTQSFLDR